LSVLGVLAVVAAFGGAWYFVTARPTTVASAAAHAVAATPQPGGAATPQPGSAASLPSSGALSGWPTAAASPTTLRTDLPIVVDVVGKVVAPGVVELPPGSRIRDAVHAAGGALPGTDLTALDLASRLNDGQEIFVGIAPPSGAAAQAAGGVVDGAGATTGGAGAATGQNGSAAGGSSSGIVDVNTATLTDLETLPGVGPVLAQHIVDWRTQHGRFTAITQLQQVSGIGPSKYADLVARVRV
ncbi:MAG: ComEA family DNA-binding protein, partial [Acidothermaceae bacterium]